MTTLTPLRADYARQRIHDITEAWGDLRRSRNMWVLEGKGPWPLPKDALASLKVEVEDMQREIEKHG